MTAALCTGRAISATYSTMQRSLPEFVSMPEAELIRMIDTGPLLVTQDEEPRFVAQSIEQYEAMIRRLRELEAAYKSDHPKRLARVIPLFKQPG